MPSYRQIVYLSVVTFVASFIASLILFLQYCGFHFVSFEYQWWFLPFYFLAVNIILALFLRGFAYQVALRSSFLGSILAVGATLSAVAPPPWHVFGWYTCVMAVFHYSEFLTIAVTNPTTLSIDSFILNHSTEYGVAAVASWIEFLLEAWLLPGLKQHAYVSLLGLAVCVAGELMRKLAMCTARTNFNHIVQLEHEATHQLVTHGVYNLFRHPSYVGWFYWSVGTQIILLNPLCIVAYAIASWKFFHNRVLHEEVTLLNFFGEEYQHYQKRVPTGLPFIHGFKLEL